MKILKTITVFLMIVAVTMFFIGGCNKDSGTGSKEKLIGTWQLILIKANLDGIPTNIEPDFLDLEVTLEVRQDGTYTLTQTELGVTNIQNGTWTANSSTVTINPENGDPENIKYSIDGDEATLETVMYRDANEDGIDEAIPVKMVYTRQ